MKITDDLIQEIAFNIMASREAHGFPGCVTVADVHRAVEAHVRNKTPSGIAYSTVSFGTIQGILETCFKRQSHKDFVSYTL